jgi:hypothetical protein
MTVQVEKSNTKVQRAQVFTDWQFSNMIISYTIALLLGILSLSLCSLTDAHRPHPQRRRCAFGDHCWPSKSEWDSFNSSISTRLVSSVPPAAVCHHELYDAVLCNNAIHEWNNGSWRTSQAGAYTDILWELGNDQCFINTPIDAPCEPGLGECGIISVRGCFTLS